MGPSQWSQLKESFETALKKHSKLVKYYICTPLDRQDPRRPKEMWFMDHWNEKTAEWKSLAKAQGREIEFVYWGSSELLHRLSKENNAGRSAFWFSKEEFTEEWFNNVVKSSTLNLGKRYTPEHNFKLPITTYFDAMSRNAHFKLEIQASFHNFLVAVNKTLDSLRHHKIDGNIEGKVKNLELLFEATQGNQLENIPLSRIYELVEGIANDMSEAENILNDQKLDKQKTDYVRHLFERFRDAFYSFVEYLRSPSIALANLPLLLLVGEAGVGKSHILADIATTRLQEKNGCIFLLGQHFTSDDSPWTQILRNLLRLNCSEKELLGALNARAEAQVERLIFIVDALNEGRGKYFWPEHVNGFINSFASYPWLGLVLSVRTSYEKLIVSKDIPVYSSVTRLRHTGFKGFEHEASTFFFSQYGIEHPAIPLLHPEFSNPLFLKLFCEGLYRSGHRKVPKGFNGISKIIDNFLESIDRELSKPARFDYPEGRYVVRKVVEELIKHKLKNNLSYVSYEHAFEIADAVVGKFTNKRRFLDALISEGVLSLNIFWQNKDEHEEGVYLSYERFEDHITTAFILDQHVTNENLDGAFKSPNVIGNIIEESSFSYGILESLAIQVPERFGKDLYELVDSNLRCSAPIIETFISSLLWRKPETIPVESHNFVKTCILPENSFFDSFIQVVYSVASDVEHPYNARMLHQYLAQFPLPDRDELWTVHLHDQDFRGSAIQRLISWAKSDVEKGYLTDSATILLANALSWLFVSTNIALRDSSTQALGVLLEDRVPTIIGLIGDFKDIDDLYILERVLAASYGAILRSNNLNQLDRLSGYLISNIFNDTEKYSNVLVRDYARNIIEFAMYKGIYTLDNPDSIRPPYKSKFPATLPTNEEIDTYKFDYNDPSFKDYYWSQNAILDSMVTEYGRGTCSYGDFGRYVFQSNVDAWDQFDPNLLSNYACQLIFQKYGYDVEKHGVFDRHASSGDRHKNKKERIGKKYQWLAMYEVVARLSDNYQLVDEGTRWSEDKKHTWFSGPWEPFVRNIDPTVVVNKSQDQKEKLAWWNLPNYSDWSYDNSTWLSVEDNLPDPTSIIVPVHSPDSDWLTLERHVSWEEPTPLGVDKHEHAKKCLWYQIRSYFVHDDEADALIDYLSKVSFGGRWFPEGHDTYQVFSREFYWSPAYRFFDDPYFGRSDWENVYDRDNKGVLGSVLPTSEGHMWESGAESEIETSYLAPREIMFTKMNLQYSKRVGEWINEAGQVICFDPRVGHDASSGLVVKKEPFLRFLSENGLRVFWTCLGEKNIYGLMHNERYNHWLEISGLYYVQNDKVEGSMRTYLRK